MYQRMYVCTYTIDGSTFIDVKIFKKSSALYRR